jgi:hypothetical protein
MDMRMVHSVVINENEASSGVMVVVHVQSQVPKPDIDEFVLKTGFMCLRSGISISCFPYGIDRIDPHAWMDWPKYHNMMERPTVTVDNVTYVAIRAKNHDEARSLYAAVLKRSAVPAALRAVVGSRSVLSDTQGAGAQSSLPPPNTSVQHPLETAEGDEVSDFAGSNGMGITGVTGAISMELRDVVNQMVSESVRGHVEELNRTLGEKIESLGQVLMTHFGGVIRHALTAPTDADHLGQQQLALRNDTHRNV